MKALFVAFALLGLVACETPTAAERLHARKCAFANEVPNQDGICHLDPKVAGSPFLAVPRR